MQEKESKDGSDAEHRSRTTSESSDKERTFRDGQKFAQVSCCFMKKFVYRNPLGLA